MRRHPAESSVLSQSVDVGSAHMCGCTARLSQVLHVCQDSTIVAYQYMVQLYVKCNCGGNLKPLTEHT